MDTVREEVDRAVGSQRAMCDERAKRFEDAVALIPAMNTKMDTFMSESREHRKAVDCRVASLEQTNYGDGSDGNKGLTGECIVLREQVNSHQKLVNRGIAAIVGIFVTGAGGWIASIWQIIKGGNAPQ